MTDSPPSTDASASPVDDFPCCAQGGAGHRHGPPGFIPVLSRPYIGEGGTARAMADAERADALTALLVTVDRICNGGCGSGSRNDLGRAAARARRAFGIS